MYYVYSNICITIKEETNKQKTIEVIPDMKALDVDNLREYLFI